MFIVWKIIDRSTLRQGFQIPVEYHDLLRAMPGGMPQHGETRDIKIVINGVEYDAQLKNQGFDRNKFDGHAEVIQVRYSEGSALAKRLREIFYITWNYNPQIQISAESETKRSIFRKRDKTKRSKKESTQHSKSRNKSFVMTSVSAL